MSRIKTYQLLFASAAVLLVEEMIGLGVVGLKAGTYTVDVNGVTGTFTLDVDNALP
jgi:hypothetical protein